MLQKRRQEAQGKVNAPPKVDRFFKHDSMSESEVRHLKAYTFRPSKRFLLHHR